MIKSLGKLTLATVLAAFVIGMPMTVPAQTNSATTTKSTKSASVHGVVNTVDTASNSFTIKNGKKFVANSSTVITIDDKKVTDISKVVKDQKVAITYMTAADGTMTATKLKFSSTSAPVTK